MPGPLPRYPASTSPVTGGGWPGGGGIFPAGAPKLGVHWAADPDRPTYNERLRDVWACLPAHGSPWPKQQVVWPFLPDPF